MRTTAATGKPTALGVDLGAVAGDDAGALEPLNALGDGRGREADAAAELRHPQPAVGSEFLEELQVDGVEELRFIGGSVSCPWLSRHLATELRRSAIPSCQLGRDHEGVAISPALRSRSRLGGRLLAAPPRALLRRQRRLPLPRPRVRGAAVRARRAARRRLAADRERRRAVRPLAPALARAAHARGPAGRRVARRRARA